jgi:hypothetical protein
MKYKLKITTLLIISFSIYSCEHSNHKITAVNLIPVSNGTDYQYIDQEGKIVINPQFDDVSIFREGLALVRTSGDEPRYGFISEDGKFKIAAKYKYATIFSDGLAWVVSENTAPIAINTKGEIQFTLQEAQTVKLFKEGLSAYSIIDNTKIEETETYSRENDEIAADTTVVDTAAVGNTSSYNSNSLGNRSVNENFKYGTKWGFISKDGKIKINAQFSNTGNFSEGKCAVQNNKGKWGYIDKEGKLLINYQFEEAKEFIDGKAIVFSADKAGVIDLDGKYIINPQFSNMKIDGDKFLIEQDGKWGWCDKEGKIIINPQFTDAHPFWGNDLAPIESGKSWGYIDKDGKIVINPQFDGALPFNGEIALVGSNDKIGFIDSEGKYVINPQFDGVSRDFVKYLTEGNSVFAAVETDFFNMKAIVDKINVNKPEGLSLPGKLSDVISKLKITESTFNQYTTEHMVISSQKITNDASYSFYVITDAFKEVPNGWYSERVFNPDALIQTYAYLINVSGKGAGKEEDILTAIEKSLSGYRKDIEQYTQEVRTYTNNKQLVKLFIKNSQIIVVITSI